MRPSARQLAQNIRSTVPDAALIGSFDGASAPAGELGGPGDDGDERPRPISRFWGGARTRSAEREPASRLLIAGAAAAAIVLTLTLVLALALPLGPPEPAAIGVDPPDASPSTTSPPQPLHPTATAQDEWFPDAVQAERSDPIETVAEASPPAETARPPDPSTEVQGIGGAAGCSTDPDDPTAAATTAGGAPCPVELTLIDGVLRVAGDEFHLGLTDAIVAVGDFACAGKTQPAILDRATGDVFVFDRWAEEDRPATATVLERLEGARRLLAEPSQGTECHRLVGLDGFGIRHVLDPASTPVEGT